MMVKWGQQVVVRQAALRGDYAKRLPPTPQARVLAVVAPSPSLVGSVLVAFNGSPLTQWVREQDVQPLDTAEHEIGPFLSL